MMVIENIFNIKQEVYLKTDNDQRSRIVTAIIVKESSLLYELACGESSTWHFDFEISETKDILKATTND